MKEDLSVLNVTCEPKAMFSDGKETKTAFLLKTGSCTISSRS